MENDKDNISRIHEYSVVSKMIKSKFLTLIQERRKQPSTNSSI
jgi:hypothetical protein